ncbi:uncharacterized protein TNIN_445351 [Trichonephila inaurata madagascariensis]|uniref:Uncharacterized protein n=1 Tax=Trichonephila inaurata madagascariensis TaxID=2747483 RepID=A0A8X7CRQ0_9ARAC|nr:uncharacterized protein TNIN_445351 [Trichonephila inaurata madagascariensis]
MASQRTISLEKSFQSLETAVSDTTRTLTRSIKVEWQKVEKYKELSTAKEDERVSLQERVRNLNENRNMLEKQLLGVEKRIQSLKNSNEELKRSLNNTRRQEDKVSREYNTEKQMMDEKITYYRRKWQERYESRYANKPLVQEFEQAKRALSDMKDQLQYLKSDLHECNAEIFKAKCERGKRNAEENGFYPIEFFIVRLASVGDEVVKSEEEENKILKAIDSLQRNIDMKLMENKAKESALNLNKLQKSKSQIIREINIASSNNGLEQPLDIPIKRKGITGKLYSIPHKIIRGSEDSFLNKYGNLSKPPQNLETQTSDKRSVPEWDKQVMQEVKIRNRMEKLKLYTPIFSTFPEPVPETTTANGSDSTEMKNNWANTSNTIQASYIKDRASNQNISNRITLEENTNPEPALRKSVKANALLNTPETPRVKELQSNSKKRLSSFSETMQKDPVMQSKNRLTFASNTLIENFEKKDQYISNIAPLTKNIDSLKNPVYKKVSDKNYQEKNLRGNDDSSEISQELFVNNNEENEQVSNVSPSKTHQAIGNYNDKEYRFTSKTQSSEAIQKSKIIMNKENWLTDKTIYSKNFQDFQTNHETATHRMKEKKSSKPNNESLVSNDLEMRFVNQVNVSNDYQIQNKSTKITRNAEEHRIATPKYAKQMDMTIIYEQFPNTEIEKNHQLPLNSDKNYNQLKKSQEAPIELGRKCDIPFVTQQSPEKGIDITDQEMQEVCINNELEIDSSLSVEMKHAHSASTYVEQEQMDVDSVQDTRSTFKVNNYKEAQGQELRVNRYDIHPEEENKNGENFPCGNILREKVENDQSLVVSHSTVVTIDKTADQHQEKHSKIAAEAEGRDLNATIENVCDVDEIRILHSLADDSVRTQLNRNPMVSSSVKSIESSIDDKDITEVNTQIENEIPNYTCSLQSEKSEISPPKQSSATGVPIQSKLCEPTSSSSTVGTQKATNELQNYPSSNKSTSSSDVPYTTPKSSDFASKLQPSFQSPPMEVAKTPTPQKVRMESQSPFDFQKHMEILGELKKTPDFIYETRQMFKAGNNTAQMQEKIPLEEIKTKSDMFGTMTFFDKAPAENGTSPKLNENEKSKTEESGFLSFALEDYLADSPDSPEQVGKEKSMFSFGCDSPRSDGKSPEFFPLFAADTQESAKEAKSGFVFNFGGAEKASSPDQGSFKFLF